MEGTTPTMLRMPWRLDAAAVAAGRVSDKPKSWIQLAKVGKFTSSRYGEFEITPQDLAVMAANFVAHGQRDRTPIDYDHLSVSPKVPGDAAAAGWLQKLETRNDGAELWGLVHWTAPAAQRIAACEYRFVSPSFSKTYTTNAGVEIGPYLHAAALTNSPFLNDMQGVTLCADPRFGWLAAADADDADGDRAGWADGRQRQRCDRHRRDVRSERRGRARTHAR